MHMSTVMSFDTYKIAELCDHFPVKKNEKKGKMVLKLRRFIKLPAIKLPASIKEAFQ